MRGTWYAYSPDMAFTKFTIKNKKNPFNEVMFANKKNKNTFTYILKKPLNHNQYNKFVNILNRLQSGKKVSKKDKKSFVNNKNKHSVLFYTKSYQSVTNYVKNKNLAKKEAKHNKNIDELYF